MIDVLVDMVWVINDKSGVRRYPHAIKTPPKTWTDMKNQVFFSEENFVLHLSNRNVWEWTENAVMLDKGDKRIVQKRVCTNTQIPEKWNELALKSNKYWHFLTSFGIFYVADLGPSGASLSASS